MAILQVIDVTKRFGGIAANQDISLDVGEWEIVGLIGPNGAGKTTLFNCITGVYPVDGGRIRFRGQDITTMKTHERARLGLGRSFQNLGLVRGQTVLQNVVTAQHLTADYSVIEGIVGTPASFAVERELVRRADRILEFTNLTPYRDDVIDDLPYGVLKNIELAAVLATDPQMLLLDEPSSGLSPTESEELGDVLLRLREELGVTILMIEHHVPLVVRVCDYVYVLNFGMMLAKGKPAEVQQHPDVVAAYLGGEAVEDDQVAAGPADGEDLVAAAPPTKTRSKKTTRSTKTKKSEDGGN